MRRTFFQLTFNAVLGLISMSLFCFFLEASLTMINHAIDVNDLAHFAIFSWLQAKLTLISPYVDMFTKLTGTIALSCLAFEGLHRIIKDSLWNYLSSIYQTLRLRQFLKQDNQSEPLLTADSQSVTHDNPILKVFNQSVSKCVVDIRKETVTVLLHLPKTQQAQKILKEMEEDIKEEIANRYPHYYFSAPNRIGSQLWFIGTRR
ncbi:hypothetical protein SAMN04487839_11728 [Streptococcus gallolyticus]|uniref:Uncharacterized protein n=3 Tax=Streptococcus gallolyticus TaxID=315405 RepID=A0A1H9STG1_9STRE|nr:hypothetical protein SAMN02910295_1447 [Streptococcus gallolyticus]SEM35601.1 hypothetical protein SAMN04487839_11728 [Streptococcus gallolyticus]SER88256.1 hypothetical protein SAMN04487840_11124 [Streptococcus gallolyticus]